MYYLNLFHIFLLYIHVAFVNQFIFNATCILLANLFYSSLKFEFLQQVHFCEVFICKWIL